MKRLRILCRQKQNLYSLVTISGDPIIYGDKMINIETELITIQLKNKIITMSFDILLLGKDEVVLGMPWL